MTTEIRTTPEAAAVAAEVRRNIEARVIQLDDGVSVLAVPSANGQVQILSVKRLLEEYDTAPERREGTARLQTLGSFIAFVERHADEHSALFADRGPNPAITCVFDYHEKNGHPRFGAHRAVYAFPLAPEWTSWDEQDGKALSQGDFAAWLEDHLADVADPAHAGKTATSFAKLHEAKFATPSRLLALSRGMSVHVDARVQQQVRLQTGEARVSFESSHAVTDGIGSTVDVPSAFLLGIPVFQGGDLYQIAARLRYRVTGAAITWSYDLHRADEVFDHAVEEACALAMTGTELPLFYGAPEEP